MNELDPSPLRLKNDTKLLFLSPTMMNTLRFMNRLISVVIFLLGAGLLSTIPAANSLTEDESQQFRINYRQSCLSGTAQIGLQPEEAEEYCQCTVEQILSFPDEKLQALNHMESQDIQVDPEIREIVLNCWQPLE